MSDQDPSAPRRTRILVADDEPHIRRILASSGFEVVGFSATSRDGRREVLADTLRAFGLHPGRFDSWPAFMGSDARHGLAVLPLNWDYYTNLVFNNLNGLFFQNFYGTLDGSGKALATLYLGPAPGSAGLVMSYAYILLNPFDFASNPVNIEVVQ